MKIGCDEHDKERIIYEYVIGKFRNDRKKMSDQMLKKKENTWGK